MTGLGRQLLDSDAATAEREALGFDSSLFGAAGVPAPIFQALVPRRAGVHDEHAHTFGTVDGPASFTRASLGLYRDAAGAWAVAAANEIRFDHDAAGAVLGYLFEPASTNEFLNSDAAATQNIALGTGTFTCSVHGAGSVTSSDGTGTASGHGAATDGTPVTIVVSGAGTITYTVSGSPTYVQVEELAVSTSPIITAGVSATRAIDALSWAAPPAGFSQDEGLILLDWTPGFSAPTVWGNNKQFVSLRSGGLDVLYLGRSGGHGLLRAYDGTNVDQITMTGEPIKGTRYRLATRWSSALSELQVGLKNGSWVFGSGSTFRGTWGTLDELKIFKDIELPSHISRLRVFNRDFSAAEIERLF